MRSSKIKRVLVCRPTYFNVEYIINPRMQPYSVNSKHAIKQWENLVKVLKTLKIKVEVIDQREDVPDMVFAADQGIIKNGAVLLANFRFSQRQKERVYYREWYRDNGFRLRSLSNVFPFEASDALAFDGMLFVGTNFRASTATCEELAQKLDMQVVPLQMVDPYFYQLSMAFLPINDKTAFYYPSAISKNSQELLKKLIPDLRVLSKQSAHAYAANSFVCDKDIIIAKNIPEDFHADLRDLGMKIHEVDVSEFNKAGGGIYCLINVLE